MCSEAVGWRVGGGGGALDLQQGICRRGGAATWPQIVLTPAHLQTFIMMSHLAACSIKAGNYRLAGWLAGFAPGGKISRAHLGKSEFKLQRFKQLIGLNLGRAAI